MLLTGYLELLLNRCVENFASHHPQGNGRVSEQIGVLFHWCTLC